MGREYAAFVAQLKTLNLESIARKGLDGLMELAGAGMGPFTCSTAKTGCPSSMLRPSAPGCLRFRRRTRARSQLASQPRARR